MDFKVGDFLVTIDDTYGITNTKCKYPFKIIYIGESKGWTGTDIAIKLDDRDTKTSWVGDNIWPVESKFFKKIDLEILGELGD